MLCRRSFQVSRASRILRLTFARPSYGKVGLRSNPTGSSQVHHRTQSTLATRHDFANWHTSIGNIPQSDTIYALSTAPGRAAIAVIRISGPACLEIYQQLCPERPLDKPRTACLRKLYAPDSHAQSREARVLDSGALVLYFPAPKTVTGEDVLELHVHGGTAIVRSVLNAISTCGSCLRSKGRGETIRHAEPGEFTKRAFYNGRLDLTQAEALGETLAAETEQQRRLAVSGTDGGLARRYEEWRTMLLYARGELEALIDFSEDQHFDESPVEFMASVSKQVVALKRQIELHLQNASKGELLRSGISIALLGAPNAGKSSLLNRIVGREAAIVNAEEGTTRDIVDVSVDLNGWLCRLGDMAGLRTGDQREVGVVEQEGIRRARERALQSDVIVVLLSIDKGHQGRLHLPVNEEVLEAVRECHATGKHLLVALNKVDLVSVQNEDTIRDLRYRVHQAFPMVPDHRVCLLSCHDASNPSPSANSTRDLDPGGLQAFLKTLTQTFAELTTPSSDSGQQDASMVSSMTPAEAQSYWSASLSVTHRQSTYLAESLHHLEAFLSVAGYRSPQLDLPQLTKEYSRLPTEEAADDIPDLSRISHGDYSRTSKHIRDDEDKYDFHIDRHDDLVGPNMPLSTSPSNPHAGTDDTVDIVTAAEHLRFAANCLAKITGKGEAGDVEDVLGVVFEK